MKYPFRSLLVAAVLIVTASQAHAAFVLTLSQVGADVVVTGSGTLNVTALAQGATTSGYGPQFAPFVAYLLAGPLGSTATAYFSGVSGPANFGPGNQTFSNIGTGDFAGIEGGFVIVPSGYVSGSVLSDTATFSNATLSSLGFTPGTYTFTWGTGPNSDSLTVTSVPEPSTWALCGVGAGLLALLLHFRPLNARRGRSLIS
ncbi:MAG: PEP-CTERM sorting domain-containing protein [Chthoniobacterales bacterium]